MHRITKVLYSGAIACSIVAGGVVSASANAVGSDGCTPGYWKNHTSNWQEYSASTPLSSVFKGAALGPYSDLTLHQALSLKGGSTINGATEILLRAASAATLNAAYDAKPGDDFFGYPLRRGDTVNSSGVVTKKGIFTMVREALATGDRATIINLAAYFDSLNNSECPLN
jgi:hypothetical protein